MSAPSPLLYPNQLYAVEETMRAFREGVEVVAINSPTGSGKSIIAAEVSRRYRKEFKEPSFGTTPQVSLTRQYAADPNVRAVQPGLSVIVGRNNFECHRDRLTRRYGTPITPAEAVCLELDPGGSVRRFDHSPLGTSFPCRCDERPLPAKWSHVSRPCVYKAWNEELPVCGYYRDKALAQLAPFTVATLAYFSLATDFYRKQGESNGSEPPNVPWGWGPRGKLPGRSLLIVDEAHGLEAQMLRDLSSRWHDVSYGNEVYERAWERFAASDRARDAFDHGPLPDEEGARLVEELVKVFSPLLKEVENATDVRERKFLESLAHDLERVENVANDIRAGVPWVVRYKMGRFRRRDVAMLETMPVVASPHLKRYLWARTRRVVVMSGSFLDVRQDLREMGLEHLRAREIFLPSEFPPQYGPVLKVPVARFTRAKREEALPAILAALGRVLAIEKGRGVVHAQSFANVEEVGRWAPEAIRGRLLLHRADTEVTREELIERFREESAPGDVLVSPSVTEGLDLPGERGEFAVFLKASFPDLSDPRVARRKALADGALWYVRQALLATVQGRGRVLRSRTDRARCHLLDEAHVNLVTRYSYLLPLHVRQAVLEGDLLLRDPGLWNYLRYGTAWGGKLPW